MQLSFLTKTLYGKEFSVVPKNYDDIKDIKHFGDVTGDELISGVIKGEFDGGYAHLITVDRLVKRNQAYIYRKLDWVNPEFSHALLVFHKDFIKNHPDQVEKIIRAYMRRIKYEHSLSPEERLKDPGQGAQKGLQMEKDFQGMNLPQYNFPPWVSLELLREMQSLLLKHGYIDKKVNLEDFVDNSFVQKVKEGLD